MAILERHIQTLRAGNLNKKWEQWENEWRSLEKRLGGFPDKRYYALITGRNAMGTIVWEREWESMAAMEAAYNRMFQEPEVNSLGERGSEFMAEESAEIYGVRGM